MNRSLLLVVCDFLLLSILALARFDVPADAVVETGDIVVETLSGGSTGPTASKRKEASVNSSPM